MKFSKLGSLFIVAGLFSISALASAQNPSPAQAQQMLQNPAMLQQLRQKIMTSGLTPDQVRARLRAEGYPETLLDAYLPGGSGVDTSATTEDVFSAISQLGIADTVEVELLRCGVNTDTLTVPDTLPSGLVDTTMRKRLLAQRREAARAACAARTDSLQRGIPRVRADADSGFVIFGLDFFRNATSQFDPNLSGPVDANYRINPGDRLVLVLTGDVEQSYTLDVTREGFIVIPQVGQIWVNNLTMGEMENVLYSRLGRVYSGVRRGAGATTHFYITPARLSSNQIFVIGEAQRPNSYVVSSAGTALTALYAAGGPSPNGSLRRIEIRRGGRVVDTLDVYDYLIRGDASHDVRLESGDVVFVPVHGPRVRIVGEIVRPATYELKGAESLADLVVCRSFCCDRRPPAHAHRAYRPSARPHLSGRRSRDDRRLRHRACRRCAANPPPERRRRPRLSHRLSDSQSHRGCRECLSARATGVGSRDAHLRRAAQSGRRAARHLPG